MQPNFTASLPRHESEARPSQIYVSSLDEQPQGVGFHQVAQGAGGPFNNDSFPAQQSMTMSGEQLNPAL